jgi:N-formylglutamate deformylase
MQESWPFEYLQDVAAGVQPYVRSMLEAVLGFVEGSKIKT